MGHFPQGTGLEEPIPGHQGWDIPTFTSLGETTFPCTSMGIPTLQHHGGNTLFLGCQEELAAFY